MSSTRIPLGISACLMGEEVRFDGGHKRSRFLTELLGDCVERVPMSPEVQAGLGVLCGTFRLAKDFGEMTGVHMIGNRSDQDVTDVMRTAAFRMVKGLGRLRGFVPKKGSPSCGLERVRENFITRIFTYDRSLPLVVPLTLLYHHFRHLKADWVDCQISLQPRPGELALRSVI